MKLHLLLPVLTSLFSSLLATLPIPELHFEEKIFEDDNTDITCSFRYTENVEVNLEITQGNITLKDCNQKRGTQTNNVFYTNRTCTVEVTMEMDNTDFLCDAYFKTESEPKKMYVQREPTITDCPNKLVWVEGEENSFHCKATGYPVPTVTCKKDQAIYQEGTKHKTWRNMTGNYTCKAINFDSDSKIVEVFVQYKPEAVEVKVSPPLHNEGDMVTMTCKASGDPTPTYTWTTPSSNVQFSADNTTLTIEKMEKSHLGKYKCTAKNQHGSHSLEKELGLAVQPKISDKNVKPSMEVLEGENVTLSCEATGVPPPDLSWSYPKVEVNLSPDKRTLKIWSFKKDHVGNYSCTARNDHGSVTRTQEIKLAESNRGGRTETSVTTILTLLISTSLMIYLS
ncbi:limbic system-associated membrane protein-like isoform X2 [Engystomops pustulosus]|uniref:limbic system-associated membrane protein-like isoform X2 n=1 Tax=Engystomops pustulosus TaxID=76066 RepID=UPI003AFAB274